MNTLNIPGGIIMGNGKILENKEIAKIVKFILNKFHEEKLTYDEAWEILHRAEELVGEYSMVGTVD